MNVNIPKMNISTTSPNTSLDSVFSTLIFQFKRLYKRHSGEN